MILVCLFWAYEISPFLMQLSEVITGHPPTDDDSIEEESEWILRQLLSDGAIPPQVAELQVVKEKKIDKDDIGRVLTMMHVQKLDVSFFFFLLYIFFYYVSSNCRYFFIFFHISCFYV